MMCRWVIWRGPQRQKGNDLSRSSRCASANLEVPGGRQKFKAELLWCAGLCAAHRNPARMVTCCFLSHAGGTKRWVTQRPVARDAHMLLRMSREKSSNNASRRSLRRNATHQPAPRDPDPCRRSCPRRSRPPCVLWVPSASSGVDCHTPTAARTMNVDSRSRSLTFSRAFETDTPC